MKVAMLAPLSALGGAPEAFTTHVNNPNKRLELVTVVRSLLWSQSVAGNGAEAQEAELGYRSEGWRFDPTRHPSTSGRASCVISLLSNMWTSALGWRREQLKDEEDLIGNIFSISYTNQSSVSVFFFVLLCSWQHLVSPRSFFLTVNCFLDRAARWIMDAIKKKTWLNCFKEMICFFGFKNIKTVCENSLWLQGWCKNSRFNQLRNALYWCFSSTKLKELQQFAALEFNFFVHHNKIKNSC